MHNHKETSDTFRRFFLRKVNLPAFILCKQIDFVKFDKTLQNLFEMIDKSGFARYNR